VKFSYPSTEPFNFGGLDIQEWETARAAIFPVPYNATTYWKSDTKDGPRAIIEASRHMELYDQELDKDIASAVGIFTLPELEVSKNSPRETIARIERVMAYIFRAGKFPLMLGGEHSIALGGVRAAAKAFPRQLSVLQFDAHTDSRDEFEGTKFHHGCTMRRVVEDLKLNVTHVGIRSTSEDEMAFLKRSKRNIIFFAPELPAERIISTLKKNVYITFDLDYFDTAIMPATGTPEPGGCGWYETLALLKRIATERNIIGADIVELAPIPGMNAPDFLAAKLAYKLIGYVLANN